MPFIPHTDDEVAAMLELIGANDIDQLFEEIPADLMVTGLPGVAAGMGEAEVTHLAHQRAATDHNAVAFIGAGAYEHHIPAAVWDLATRGEFYSAYTPYQAEASQGTLQLLYEYQSMMVALTGLDVSNASLYDGATAYAEACLMAVRANRKSQSRRILTTRAIHPVYRSVARTIVAGQGVELVELPVQNGTTDLAALAAVCDEDFAAISIPQPGFLGTLESVDELTNQAHAAGRLVIAVCNPLALAALKPPACWGDAGADIACGEGQPLGVPLSCGGPYFGYMTCRKALVRQLPGRIVGRTVDVSGKPGFTLTLQAREQHIRRSRATSNICTNQGLMVTAATIYLSLLGGEGLYRVAAQCHARTRELVGTLTQIAGVSVAFQPFFHEAVIGLDRPAAPVLAALARRGILGGYDLSADYPELGSAFLTCATEARSAQEIEAYGAALKDVLEEIQVA